MERNRNEKLKYEITMADLRPWDVVTAACGACPYFSTVPVSWLTANRPPHTLLINLQHQLVCTRCKNRSKNRLTVTMVER
jgi:hypothetical protein